MNMEHQQNNPVCFVNVTTAQIHAGVFPPLSARCHDVAPVLYTTIARYIGAQTASVQ
jgi:hypothetical protein